MNINIAFNTIIYIMVFLLPGFLFRSAFFSGKFNKQFDSGNTFERFLWNLLLSIFCIATFSSISYLFNKIQVIRFEFDVTVNEIIDSFISLYKNEFPNIFKDYAKLKSIFSVLASLCVFSAIIGFFLHNIIFALGLEKRFSIFKFQDNWIYLTNSNKKNNSKHSLGDLYYTKIDVKSSNNELFTGELLEILSNKDGGIDAITMKETYKFYSLDKNDENEKKISEVRKLISDDDPYIIMHHENSHLFCYRKRIKGDIFSISDSNIENISITFVKISGFYERFQNYFNTGLTILLLLLFVSSIAYSIWDFHLINFPSTMNRIAFSINTFLSGSLFIILIDSLFDAKKFKTDKKEYSTKIKNSFIVFIFFILPYFSIFGYIKWGYWFIISITYLALLGNFISKTKDEE